MRVSPCYQEDLPLGTPAPLRALFEPRPVTPSTPEQRPIPRLAAEFRPQVNLLYATSDDEEDEENMADADTLPWGSPPPLALVIAQLVGSPLSRPPPPVPHAVRLRARQLENIEPRVTAVYGGYSCTWMFSTRFWEVLLIRDETLTMPERQWMGNDVVLPIAPVGYLPIWRGVSVRANRRWSLMADRRLGTAPRELTRTGTD